VHLAWVATLAAVAGAHAGAGVGVLALFVLIVLGGATLVAGQWWDRAAFEARSFLLLKRRESLRQRLLARRRALAEELETLRDSGRTGSRGDRRS
jgi:hypothetical protein